MDKSNVQGKKNIITLPNRPLIALLNWPDGDHGWCNNKSHNLLHHPLNYWPPFRLISYLDLCRTGTSFQDPMGRSQRKKLHKSQHVILNTIWTPFSIASTCIYQRGWSWEIVVSCSWLGYKTLGNTEKVQETCFIVKNQKYWGIFLRKDHKSQTWNDFNSFWILMLHTFKWPGK